MIALQAPTNALLARAVGSPVNAAFVSFAVGAIVLLVAAFLLGVRPAPAAVRALPWYAWAGGAYGAIFVALAAFAAPRIGVTSYLTVAIAGQLAMALLIDRIGAFGLDKVELSASRLIGVALVLAGALLVRR
jgi:transporter family-2 protein